MGALQLEGRWQRVAVLLVVLITHGWVLQKQWLLRVNQRQSASESVLYLVALHESVLSMPSAVSQPAPIKAPISTLIVQPIPAPLSGNDDVLCRTNAGRCNPMVVTRDMATPRAPEIDWHATAEAVVRESARTEQDTQPRIFGPREQDKQSMFEAAPKTYTSPDHKNGDVERFDDGVKRIWVNKDCNLNTDNNGLRFTEFALGVPERSGSKLTCTWLRF